MGGLTVVTGPPCAGKTTHITEHREPADVVIDLDHLAVALGSPHPHVAWTGSRSGHDVLAYAVRAFLVRTLMEDLKSGGFQDRTVWLVATAPQSWQWREYERVGADIVELDPGREECHRRAAADGRPAGTGVQIDRWYAERGTLISALSDAINRAHEDRR